MGECSPETLVWRSQEQAEKNVSKSTGYYKVQYSYSKLQAVSSFITTLLSEDRTNLALWYTQHRMTPGPRPPHGLACPARAPGPRIEPHILRGPVELP